LELSFKEQQNYDSEHQARLLSLGIVTEPFGDKTLKVTEIPSFLSTLDDEAIIRDMVSSCLNDEKTDAIELLHLTIANIACKKSIKANHPMSLAEMEGLLRDLSKCQNPANCPHGRPTLIKITKDDIEKIFRRSGF
jgi:DNA mismatch repair protein MutL